ncbi:putative cytochrome P450 67 [Coleophoma crateriformis]|uniref:Putative cytochrome P450 67 n=1 Tax=Coleophoma crateriformis TaxID=565419 RepID=A0A3D8QEG7_9HELO|nr:putative cytochrome P450 67 [Coleophoma crateriformis]
MSVGEHLSAMCGFVATIVYFLSATFVAYLFFLAAYRLTFHPLAKYPGPFLAKITDWYSVYHAWKGDRHLEFWRCHEKYGPVFRYGPSSLSINTNTALKTIYGHRANVKKSQFYSVFPPTKDTFNTHSSIDKASHARKRRVLSHAFSDTAIKAMENHILANVRTFCLQLGRRSIPRGKTNESIEKYESRDQWSTAKNMADWCNYLTFDVMGDLCFGKAFGMLERDENRHVVDLIGNAAHSHLITGTNPMIKTLGLNKILFRQIYNMRMQYMAYSKAQAAERTKIGLDTDRKDFFYYLLNARDPETGNGFTPPELWGESNLLIIAGSDTTSTALAAAFFYLVHNPAALGKLEHEIRSTFSDIEEIHSSPTLNSCIYLRAVIDEAMRLSPPVGGILPREVLPGGIDIDGLHIPEGCVVGTPHYAIHHNADYYPSPFTFNPERWITDSSPFVTRDSVTLAQSAFCPFSIGSRGCIGKGVAYVELMTSLARVVWLYDMRKAQQEPWMSKIGEGSADQEFGRQRVAEYQMKDSFTSFKDGPWVEFLAREV